MVEQSFDSDVFKGNVIVGNDVILKCVFPAHVADLVSVTGWVDSEGSNFVSSEENYGN